MNARQLIERFSGPSEDEIEVIVQIIKQAHDWRQANDALAPYRVRFLNDEPTLNRTHAPGGFAPETGMVLLNAAWFHRFQWGSADLRTTIEHELTHRGQFDRAMAQGVDPNELQRSQERHLLDKNGNIRMDRYRTMPHEMQALARNAVSTAKSSRQNLPKLMRQGTLADYAPIPPGDRKRFLKYAYQMSKNEAATAGSVNSVREAMDRLNGPGTMDFRISMRRMTEQQFIREQAMLIAAFVLNEGVTRACASCEREFGPMRAEPGTGLSHGYCKRHYIQMATELGAAELVAAAKQRDDDSFPPDLAKHPELLDKQPTEVAAAGQAAAHQAQGLHLMRQ